MGERCRVAALGATFALLVAACAVTEAPRSTQAAKRAERQSTPLVSAVPESLASADPPTDDRCVVETPATVSVVDASTGALRWSVPISHDAESVQVAGQMVLVSLGWSSAGSPGLTAIDLDHGEAVWARELLEPPQSVTPTRHGLVLVGRDGVRSLDPDTGQDLWVTASEFDYAEVEVTADMAYAVDTVALHAIDLRDGSLVWQLPIDRADELAVSEPLLVVAAGSELVAVDTDVRGILWEQSVNRNGAGRLHIGSGVVAADLSPAAAPIGGVVALDRATGLELWTLDSIDDAIWLHDDLFVTSRVPENSSPAAPFEVLALESSTGETLWSVSATAPANSSVVGASESHLVIADPHPGYEGVQRIRLLEADTGALTWETSVRSGIDGAIIELGVLTTLYRTGGESTVMFASGSRVKWQTTPAPLALEPALSPFGLVLVSDGQRELCLGRDLRAPTSA